MPATRHRFSGCSHKGFGAHCHRCEQSKKLALMADQAASKRPKQYQDWDKQKLVDEAGRLKAARQPRGMVSAEWLQHKAAEKAREAEA